MRYEPVCRLWIACMYGAPWSLTIAFERSLSGIGTRAPVTSVAPGADDLFTSVAAGARHPATRSARMAMAKGNLMGAAAPTLTFESCGAALHRTRLPRTFIWAFGHDRAGGLRTR